LADVLARIKVPADSAIRRKGRRPITILGDWLARRLPDSAAQRAREAIAILQDIVDVRVGAQHSDARHKAVKAFERLGVPFVPTDWQHTWDALQHRIVSAIEVVMEEVQANLDQASD
jgi:hypothetical protein